MEPKFFGRSRLTKQGQLTMPNEARKDLKLDTKSDVFWYELNGVLILVKELVNPKDLLGSIIKKRKK